MDSASKYITLVSCDGFEFVVLREAAMVSPFIRATLDPRSQFAEAKEARCTFAEIKSVTTPPLPFHNLPIAHDDKNLLCSS